MLISAPQGRSGKTIVSVGLCALLAKRGYTVQPFKKGPDYIDPSWLSAAATRDCRNLDPFLMTPDVLRSSYAHATEECDVAVIEGAMGLYDGVGGGGMGSTAAVAGLLDVPVLLVVNAARMTGSIAAMVSGYQQFDPRVRIGGVILNNVSGERHQEKLRHAIETHCRIPVVGSIPRDSTLRMTQRHLGHVPFPERDGAAAAIERVRETVEPHLDVASMLEIADKSGPVSRRERRPVSEAGAEVRIGVIRDRVFSFYYPENLEGLADAGAELIYVDSLQDRLPDVDGLYIGGGFPEVFLEELEANTGLRADIGRAARDGLPVYAECAGLMYLCKSILREGRRYEMVGTVPADVELSARPQGHGYVEARVAAENPWFAKGLSVRGHEFHHSKLVADGAVGGVYEVKRGGGIGGGVDGVAVGNVLASYLHVHALGTPEWVRAFVGLAVNQRQRRFLVPAL